MEKFQPIFWKRDELWFDKNSSKLINNKRFS